MLDVELNLWIKCEDGKSLTATIKHKLPFIPSESDEVLIQFPNLPESWVDEGWEGHHEGIWIYANGVVGMNFDIPNMTGASGDVAIDLRNAGWHVAESFGNVKSMLKSQ